MDFLLLTFMSETMTMIDDDVDGNDDGSPALFSRKVTFTSSTVHHMFGKWRGEVRIRSFPTFLFFPPTFEKVVQVDLSERESRKSDRGTSTWKT